MIVSWDWLHEYVQPERAVDEITHRLTMTGLNLEGVEPVADDTAIDLEVTSNRPDCLGHIGVAREISALFDCPLQIPAAQVEETTAAAADVVQVEISDQQLCPRYIARVIRGVKVGPSPLWLQRRLETLGITPINNVVDVTNYVLMECGQPLHAFDLAKLAGQRIEVRPARAGEKLEAINHITYELQPQNLVIADGERPVAIAGVMGGADTEISESSTEILIETAAFLPLSVRNTARQLNLRSDSSYRFERGVDLAQLDWASRRCCELIQSTGGGEILAGSVVAGQTENPQPADVPLRYPQVERLLGLRIDPAQMQRILNALGLETVEHSEQQGVFRAPSWRRDLGREIDLIEEVARVYGYEQIPEEPPLPVVATARSRRDRVTGRLREILIGMGLFESLTMSFTSEEQLEWFRPYPDRTPLSVDHSSRRRENLLRQSIVPSLLQSRRDNERFGTSNAELFEIARVFLDPPTESGGCATEPIMLSMVSGRSFLELRGVIEQTVCELNPSLRLEAAPSDVAGFAAGRGCELSVDGQPLGWLGELDRPVLDQVGLREETTVAELRVEVLEELAQLVAHFTPLPQFPSVSRDLNLLLSEQVTWADLEQTVRNAAGPLLASVEFAGQYRGKQIAADKKSYLMTMEFRADERTLTTEEVDGIQQQILAACEREHQAELR